LKIELDIVEFSFKADKLVEDYQTNSMAGVYNLAQEIKALSQERCPVKEGTLRGSCRVRKSKDSVSITYGGASAPYALEQHERIDFHHDVGQAKYLESAFDELKGELNNRIEEANKRGFGKLVEEIA
jgi:hypothetical protein